MSFKNGDGQAGNRQLVTTEQTWGYQLVWTKSYSAEVDITRRYGFRGYHLESVCSLNIDCACGHMFLARQ